MKRSSCDDYQATHTGTRRCEQQRQQRRRKDGGRIDLGREDSKTAAALAASQQGRSCHCPEPSTGLGLVPELLKQQVDRSGISEEHGFLRGLHRCPEPWENSRISPSCPAYGIPTMSCGPEHLRLYREQVANHGTGAEQTELYHPSSVAVRVAEDTIIHCRSRFNTVSHGFDGFSKAEPLQTIGRHISPMTSLERIRSVQAQKSRWHLPLVGTPPCAVKQQINQQHNTRGLHHIIHRKELIWKDRPSARLGDGPVKEISTIRKRSVQKHHRRVRQLEEVTATEKVSTDQPPRKVKSFEGQPDRVDGCRTDPANDGIPLSLPTDQGRLSRYQLLVRQSLEFFETHPDNGDLDTERPCSRNKRLHPGQVGLRCRHCAHRPVRWRRSGSVFFPGKLKHVYIAAHNIGINHLLETCTEIPAEIRSSLLDARSNQKDMVAGKRGAKSYWLEACESLGLYEKEDQRGIYFL